MKRDIKLWKETYERILFSIGKSLYIKKEANGSKETKKWEKRHMEKISFPLARASENFEANAG